MELDVFTASMCFAGWLLHWLLSWRLAFKREQKTLLDFVDDDPPAFFISIAATLILYMLGPSILPAIGIALPAAFAEPSARGLVALLTGYSADSLITKVVKLSAKGEAAG